jgi:hypothetical protein
MVMDFGHVIQSRKGRAWAVLRLRQLIRPAATMLLFLLLVFELRRALMFWHQSSMPMRRLVTATAFLLCGSVLMMWAMWTKSEP